jgi:cytochrome c-type biogenesis protein CcmF
VNIPIGLMLLALLGIGPIIAWRKATPRNLKRNFVLPVGVGLAVAVGMLAAGIRHPQVILTFALGAFVMATVTIEFHKGARARAGIEREGYANALVHLVERNRRRYGGYIVHVGLVLTFMGFAGKAYNVEEQVVLHPGESTHIESPFGHTYRLTYQDMSWYTAKNMTKLIASFQVEKDGRPAGLMTADIRQYNQREETSTEVGIKHAWNEDLYLILAGIDDANGVVSNTNVSPASTFRILVNPLVPWVWTGGLIMAIGTMIALWPSAAAVEPKVARRATGAASEPQLVEV